MDDTGNKYKKGFENKYQITDNPFGFKMKLFINSREINILCGYQ